MVRFVKYDLAPRVGCAITSVEVHSEAAHRLFKSDDWGFQDRKSVV